MFQMFDGGDNGGGNDGGGNWGNGSVGGPGGGTGVVVMKMIVIVMKTKQVY